LKEAMRLPEYHQHAISIKFQNYVRNKFIFCASFKKIQNAVWSGINTKAGQVLM
jgi:hypothetical protein